MDKICVVCGTEGKYKCPTCVAFYCSVQCCKKHREDKCRALVENDGRTLQGAGNETTKARYTTADTVPLEKLQLLSGDENLKNLLENPHLRELLGKLNVSKEAEKAMQIAMQEPLFVEFADACLKVVEPAPEEQDECIKKK